MSLSRSYHETDNDFFRSSRSHSAQGLTTASALCSPAMKIPMPPRLWITDISDDSSDDSETKVRNDGAWSMERPHVRSRFRHHKQRANTNTNVPLGIFWDIENCQVPRGCSAIDVVAAIRNKFLSGRREADFIVVCDVRKESPSRLQELNDAQVSLIHVCGTQKNAADEKLRQCMRRFGELHSAPAALLLISGDINFAADLSDFRHRKNMEVILVHKQNTSSALIACASSHHDYSELTAKLPRNPKISQTEEDEVEPTCEMEVCNLPEEQPPERVSRRLRRLADNCGGRVMRLAANTALLRFPTPAHTARALKRMAGEDVFGRKISTRYANAAGGTAYSSDEGYCTAQQTTAHQQQTAWSLALQQLPAPPMVMAPPAACLPPPEPQAPRRIRGTHGSASMDRSWCSSSTSTSTSTCSEGGWEERGEGAELTVIGLPIVPATVLRARLIELFSNVPVPVRSVKVASTTEGPQATVMLRSLNDARLAIARIHKRRLDNQWNGRRLELSLGRAGTAPSADILRARLRAILLEQRGHVLPLLRLRDAYAGRHAMALTAADLLRVQDTVVVHEGLGRLVQLIDLRPVSPAEAEEAPWRCALHATPAMATQPEDGSRLLTCVFMELEVLAARTHVLLTDHGGVLPLLSFVECYEACFGPMYEDLDRGLPLELMLRSVPSLSVRESPSRHVCWPEADSSPSQSARSESSRWSGSGEREKARTAPSLEPLLALFEREVVDLLRTAPRCTIPFGKLIPAFHHHFGRQCRVADYGFTKLPDLLNALSSTVVVLGSGSSRVITLTAGAQGRRWTNDLVKLLKAHVGRKVTIHDIPELYQLTFGRAFRPVDYGACTVNELIARLTPQAVFLNPEDGSMSLPRRIPTSEELARTAQFAVQTVELLCYTPNLRMEFSRFVPAYNAHFGHQLRVAHYGCVKLFDLFELISDAVTVHAEGGERSVRLAHKTARLVVAQRLRALGVLPISSLPSAYAAQYGAQPLPDMLQTRSLRELVFAAGGCVQHGVVHPPGRSPQWVIHVLGACAVLANDRSVCARGSSHEYFHTNFRKLYGAAPDDEGLVAAGVVVIQDRCYRLATSWRMVWRIAQILSESQTPISAMDVFIKYKSVYETPSDIRFEEVSDMLREYGEVFSAASDGWILAEGVIVPRCRDLLPAEDYSIHDTPPGEKGSRVFETPRHQWCSPPASALPTPSALLHIEKRRTRLAAHFEDI